MGGQWLQKASQITANRVFFLLFLLFIHYHFCHFKTQREEFSKFNQTGLIGLSPFSSFTPSSPRTTLPLGRGPGRWGRYTAAVCRSILFPPQRRPLRLSPCFLSDELHFPSSSSVFLIDILCSLPSAPVAPSPH